MELSANIIIGSAASLATSLILRPLWSALAQSLADTKQSSSLWQTSNARNELCYLSAHALAGAAQGALFWLSWGFVALISAPWWYRGLAVGLGNALLLLLPLLLVSASVVRINKILWLVLSSEALAISLTVGLACSWHWAR